MPVFPGWIFGVRCGEGGKHSLIINFMSILLQFLDIFENKFKGGSNARIDSNVT